MKFNKLIIYIFLLLFSVNLVSCGEFEFNSGTKEQVTNLVLELNGKTITWNEYTDADSYDIYVNGEYYDSTENTTFSFTDLSKGSYSIQVEAKNAKISLKKSNNVILIVNEESNPGSIEKDQVNICMINDTHGSFVSTTYPGIGKVATEINELEELNGDYIKIANGDIFQGSYVSNVLYGLPLVEALNEMEFDCFVLGNHDFDWGLDKIAVYKDGDLSNGELNMPVLGANIIDKADGEIVDWVDPYTVIENNGYTVGIIGIMDDTLESSIFADYVADYEFTDCITAIKKYSTILRNDLDCDLVIVSIHGYDEDLNNSIASLSGSYLIDGIFCAHTHQIVSDSLTRSDSLKIYAVQNGDKNETITSVIYKFKNNEYISSSTEYYYVANLKEDEDIVNLYNKYTTYISEGNRVIGTCKKNVYKSELGSYCVNAMLVKYDSDIAIINTGGIRESLYSGIITVEKVFQIYPFNNYVYLVSMSGKDIKSLINRNSNYLYYNEYSSLKDSTMYTVSVIDYVYSGVYYSEFNGTTYTNTGDLLRDVLLDYLDNLY